MSEDVKVFTQKLCSLLLTEETILEEKLTKYMNETDPRLISLINHQFFAGKFKFTNYLKNALEKNPKSSQQIRKKILNFISIYVETHYLYLVEHVKQLFAQLISQFWKEQGRAKQVSLRPVVAIIQSYDEKFLVEKQVLNPIKIHNDIMQMLQTHKREHGVFGQCWHLLAVIQNKFTTHISPLEKKKVQQVCFRQLKFYVDQDKNFNTMAALLQALAKSLKENYFTQDMMGELSRHVFALIRPLKPKYNVPIAALQLLEARRELFKDYIMNQSRKLFEFFRTNVNHKNRQFSLKVLEVFILVMEIIVKTILANKQRYRNLFIYIRDIVSDDLSSHVNKNKDEPIPEQKKGFNLLTIVRLLGIMSPLYLQYEGKVAYKKIFNYIIKKCTKRILKDSSQQTPVNREGFYEIKYILYSQKQLKSFISALSQLIEQLDQIEYDAANQLEIIFIEAVKESKFFLSKYENDLWQAMVQLIMSIHLKGNIFSKWAKKVISQSLKQCLDSIKLDVSNDEQYIKMVQKAAHLWKSLINHTSWRTIPLNQFTQFLMANFQYLVLNLDCGYKIKNEGDIGVQGQIQEERQSYDQGIVNIFFTANQRIVMTKTEDYQYLSSLSLLFNQILLNIDASLYSERLFSFYHLLIQRIKTYPKCLPLLRTLRTLNQFINKNNFFKIHFPTQRFYCEELLQKMRRFFNQSLAVVFKYQEQFFYELLKILLSFSDQVYLLDNCRIIKYQLSQLIIKGLQFGQQIISLGFVAVRCLKMLFSSQKQVAETHISSVIPVLQKYINIESTGQKEQVRSHLFLYEQNITKQSVSEQVLSFLGSLGGLCHLLVDNSPHDHISWDYDCHLQVQIPIFQEKYKLNLVRILNRVCWLAVNGRDDIKIVSCQLLHAIITFVIKQIVVADKMQKDNLSVFLDRVLPTVLSVAGNTSHPSQQLLHTILIQVIHFFANTKQPNSPDIQVILKHLLSLYNKSQDMGFLASKCLSEIIRWHIKQQIHKNGDVPILKALISNIWSLVGNKNARDGIITFLVKLLRIIHRQEAIMNYYSLQLGFLLLALNRYNTSLQSQICYLMQKYTACLKRYIKHLMILNESRKYKNAKTIKEFLQWLYKTGFLSRYKQQRDASYYIWYTVIKNNSQILGFSHSDFLRQRANKEKKYLLGNATVIDFSEIQETILDKYCWRVVALGQFWLKMLEYEIFNESNLSKFEDLEHVYLLSFVSFLGFIFEQKNQTHTSWNDQIQSSIIFNLRVFLKILNSFHKSSTLDILKKFFKHLRAKYIDKSLFNQLLLYIMYEPTKIIKNFNRDSLIGQQLEQYIKLFVNYKALENYSPLQLEQSPLKKAFALLQQELGFTLIKFVDVVCLDDALGQRKIKLLLNYLKITYQYQITKEISDGSCLQLQKIVKYMIQFIMQNKIRQQRMMQVISFVLSFRFGCVFKLVIRSIDQNNQLYQRFQKSIIKYLVQHWNQVKELLLQISLSSVDNIKILYILIKKLNREKISSFLQLMSNYELRQEFLRDLLKINFILVQNQQNLAFKYVVYLQRLIQNSLKAQKSIQIHEQALYLCGLLIQKQVNLNNLTLKDLKVTVNTLTNKYSPYIISRLDSQQKQQTALKYFNIVRNFIIISEEFIFIQQFFDLLKDKQLKDEKLDIVNEYIEDCVRTCMTLDNDKPREWTELILDYYYNQESDKDEWCNFRYVIINRIFRKIACYIKVQLVQQLFNKYINKLENIVAKPYSYESIKCFLLDLQEKKGALLIVQLLYGNLPRKQKKQGMKQDSQIHKVFIKHCVLIVKNKLAQQYSRMIKEHDESSDEKKKAMNVYRQYCCHAYNCLIIMFISTQSSKQHFKTYIFQNNRDVLWEKLVDTKQSDFGFQVQTQFKLMKPYTNLRNNVKQLKAKIEKKYFQSSLYVVEQQNIPQSQLQPIKEQNEDQLEKQVVPINNANNILINTQIQEDNINKHLCMVNLLRIVDFLHKTFPEPVPGWMKPIETQLSSERISLAQRILLIKLILNRPHIFDQPALWAKHLLAYLSSKQTGGKYIHYFYRDALKRFIKFLPNYAQNKPDISQINVVLMKLIVALPHPNVNVYTDNIDMVEELLKVPGVYVQKVRINKMLKGGDSQQKKNQWRLCAIIVIKRCLDYSVPILTDEEHKIIRDRPNFKYKYYYQQIRQQMKYIFEMAVDTSKKYRIAAAGLLGQFLKFILCSKELNDVQKKQHFDYVSNFLYSLKDQKTNRTVKQRFSLALQKIAARFPQIFIDQKVFTYFEDAIVHYTGQQRYQLFLAFKYYSKESITFTDTGKIANFFMILRVNWQKMISDIYQVQLVLLQILHVCADPVTLKIKDILKTYSIILGSFGKFIHQSEPLANQYFAILIKIKKYLKDKAQDQFHLLFLQKVMKSMIEGLTCKFEAPLKLIFEDFQKDALQISDLGTTGTFIKIFNTIYNHEYQYLWLNNVVPLLLSLTKKSPEYSRLFTQIKLNEKMPYYDWDFRNFRIADASLPYTPFTMLKREPQKSSVGVLSQTSHLRGMLKATQNNYQSQQQQIFTLLQSLSPSLADDSSQNKLKLQEMDSEEDQRYCLINDLFLSRKKQGQGISEFKYANANKTSAAVKFIEDKIRFAKKVDISSREISGFRRRQNNQKLKKGAILRAYKIGQLPNIQVSLEHLVAPLIYISSKDFELSSELFLQLIETVTSVSIKNSDRIKEVLVRLLKGSERCQFNYISTIQKGLIKMCQKQKIFLDISMKQITVKSNTLDYAVLFTEQNLIQGLNQKESNQSMESINAKRQKINAQWSDLADYYQLLNEHDLIECVIIKLLDGQNRNKMIKALKEKREGDLMQAKKIFEELIIINANHRLNQFISRQKIDCTILLSQWDQICKESQSKRQQGVEQSYQELRMYTIALQNLENTRRTELMLRDNQLAMPQNQLQYQKGILCVMKSGGLDGAKYHALNSREVFRKQWLRVSSFAFNSKHDLLQSLQKNHELSQFITSYKKNETTPQSCRNMFLKWKNRQPNQIFDDNITWIQILSSRLLFGKMLTQRFEIPAEVMARSSTEWHVQMVNGMLQKGVLGYAQNTIRKAVAQHKLTREFNWDFYDSISQLKLLQLKRKGSLKLQQYSIVPKLIQKEIDQYKVNSQYNKFRLMRIKNEYFQGFLEVSLNKRKEIEEVSFVSRVIDIYNNYQQIQKGLKKCQQSPESFKKSVHFDFALFLENLLSIIRGKFQIKQIKESLERKALSIKTVAQKFIQQLVYSIKILNLNSNPQFNQDQGQKVFSMILKLIKIVQTDYRIIGSKFEEIISQNQVPKWIFLYFIPQIIKNINNYDLAIHFKQLFEYFLINYPEALVYPFNCTYPRYSDCLTDLTKFLYKNLHEKMNKYFQFIDNLFVIQHPQLRLKDILTKYLNHGQIQSAFVELKEFISPSPYLGKYNVRFNQNYHAKVTKLLELKQKGLHREVIDNVRTMIANLDPSKCNMMKYFTKLSDGSLWFEEYNLSDWMKLQIPGITYNKFEQQQSWNKIYIQSFDNTILTLTSIRRPKRISVLGSNEKVYMLLIKGGEDIRLDQRVEELFELVNSIFTNFPETSKKQLSISRFEVIPMKPMFGVFQWVDKSQTLRSFLQSQLRSLKGKPNLNLANQNEAITTFVNYLNKISPNGDKYAWHKALMQRPEEQVVRNMNKCENQLPYGLLRYSLQKLAKNYDSFLHIKNKFINNYAAICLITYIFGIGDRHLQNFLIQNSTGSIIMIDFGYSFCASIQLPIPELIPFRLTKSFDDLTKPIGIEGSFKKSLAACYQALNKKMQLIVDYCDVFVDDPLMQWVWVSRKNIALATYSKQVVVGSAGNNSFSVSQQAPQKRHFTSKIKIVQNKLKGYNPRMILQHLLTESRHKQAPYIEHLRKAIWKKSKSKEEILSSQQLISELLSLAGDKNITGRSYIGLNLFV